MDGWTGLDGVDAPKTVITTGAHVVLLDEKNRKAVKYY